MRSSSVFSGALLVGTLVAGLGACGPAGRNTPGGDDSPGIDSSVGGNGDCSDAAKFVYVVDEDNTLSKFDPMTGTFTAIGTLNCPAMEVPDPNDIFGLGDTVPATPFSMGIDRDANAWVLYNSSEVFKVSTSNASCTATNFHAPSGLSLFGMGFSTDAAGGSQDTLYIAGSDSPGDETTATKLAKLDTNTMSTTMLGSVTGSPELTGTGNAELWGFFPGTSGAKIEKINKTTGVAIETHPLANLSGQPAAWAFAFWGGDFWAFLARQNASTGDIEDTTVYHYDTTGTLKSMKVATGRHIVGAGVSTCAPVVIL
ncbi:MAG TPA: hypothetical protein VGM90_22430 [Kofleriaceae bacterium]|jgi:hypothetical protein